MLTRQLAEFAASVQLGAVPADVLDRLRLHVLDTIGAGLVGAHVVETEALAKTVVGLGSRDQVLAIGPGLRTSLPAAVLLACAAARCSEVDDIHLTSCTTPGSIVVPTALAVATWRPDLDDEAFLAGCVAGYEILIRLGVAIDGPRRLHEGVWPTGLLAGFGAAATAGRMLGLAMEHLGHALAMVAAAAATRAARPRGLTSRWFLAGSAAQHGLQCALAAACGIEGDPDVLDSGWGGLLVPVDADARTGGQADFALPATSLKPYCAARQTMAAIEGVRSVLDAQRLSVEDVREVLIEVPTVYARMIDHPLPPASRQESISDVRYQVALAALKPDQLYDVAHTIIHTDRQILDVMHRIRVQTDPALDAQYPDAWPARVTLTTHSGATLTREQVRVPGDPGTGFGWPDVRSKLLRMGLSADLESRIEQPCKNLGHGALPALLAALEA